MVQMNDDHNEIRTSITVSTAKALILMRSLGQVTSAACMVHPVSTWEWIESQQVWQTHCRQVTTGSGELPAHIGHSFEPEDRFGRSSARKADASRYAALTSSTKVDSTSARSMHASPARLIITSGAPLGPSRDSPTARSVSGELLRADSEPQRAQHRQRPPSISLVTAPANDASAERGVQRAPAAQRHPAAQAGTGVADTTPAPSRLQSHGQPSAEAQQPSSAYSQRADVGSSQQQAPDASSNAGPSAQHGSVAGQMRAPFPSRVDSLSHWGRQGDAQQRSASPQSDGYGGQQRGNFEFESGQYAQRPAGHEA